MKYRFRPSMKNLRQLALTALLCAMSSGPIWAATDQYLYVPSNRSTLVELPEPAGEIVVANPDIADVHVHNSTHVAILARKQGKTNISVMNKEGLPLRELYVTVGYDLPALRKALKDFLPNENIKVEMLNTSVALTGKVSSAAAVDRALKIAREYVDGQIETQSSAGAGAAVGALAPAAGGAQTAAAGEEENASSHVMNFLQVTSGQQVMLRVRVGEIRRSALKTLGIDLNMIARGGGSNALSIGTGGGIASLVDPGTASAVSPGIFKLPGGQTPTNTRGILSGVYQPNGTTGDTFSGLIKALEQDGLFKVLAEPNLVAISGEEAEFLSGGEIPVPIVQNNGGGGNNITVDYKPFGVAVKFRPHVLSENRIRMAVQPEVSDISQANAINISGFSVPSIETRRARTTVELAPGESFMIAGLINDTTRATIDQLPGAKQLPILGALFRSSEFQRNETELVIAVTPYLVDAVASSDVKMPTDDFRPASQMEMFFYGALGSLQGVQDGLATNQALEGPTGFMVD